MYENSVSPWKSSKKNYTKKFDNVLTYLLGGIFSNGMVWNKRIGRKFFKELINVWYGIRACWVENFKKINKRTPTLIR